MIVLGALALVGFGVALLLPANRAATGGEGEAAATVRGTLDTTG